MRHIEPHPVALVPDVADNVDFISNTAIESMGEAWPRNQECGRTSFAVPQKDDLVLAVSHAWFYAAHPDPVGLKKGPLKGMLDKAMAAHKPTSRTLLFVDFLSVPQPPVQPHHRSRTPEQEAAFAKALRAFPQIYLQADAVLHVDIEPCKIPGDLSTYKASLCELEGVTVLQHGDQLHVTDVPKHLETSVRIFDVVDAVGGVKVRTVAEYEEAKRKLLERKAGKTNSSGGWFGSLCAVDAGCWVEADDVCMKWCPYGAYSGLTASQKGWIYLERFSSMVKGAMVPEDQVQSVAFASTPEAMAEIIDGSKRLREAAALGRDKLLEVLSFFVDKLEEKHFTAVSLDKAKGTGGVGGVSREKDDLQAKQVRDAEVVGRLMRELVSDLADKWEDEQHRQRQRQLILAVNRGDLNAAAEYIEGGADLNLADCQGVTCMHQAAKGRNRDMVKLLVESKGDLSKQDVQGNTPSHMVALYGDQLTIDLFELLAPTEEILTLTNHAGVSPFDRMDNWAGTAVKNKPYEPAVKLLRSVSDRMPGLTESRKSSRSKRSSLAVKPVVVSQLDVVVGKKTIQVPILQASDSSKRDISVVWIGMSPYLPRQLEQEAVASVVGMVCSRVSIKVYLLTEDIYCEEDFEDGVLGLQSRIEGIKSVIGALPVTGRYVLVENSMGLGLPAMWANQEQLLHGIVMNPIGWFSEEFLTSAGYKSMIGKVTEQVRVYKDRDVERCLDLVGALTFTRTEKDIARVTSRVRQAIQKASPAFFASSGGNHILVDELTGIYRKLGKFGGGVSLDLVCGAYSPAMFVQDTIARIQDIAPAAKVRYIGNSKQWWECEGEEQLAEVALIILEATQNLA